jgi:hypothetical protein
MKFLYEENQHFKESGTLFSEEEVRSHIDHYFKDSHYYFQSFIDRQPLARRQALALIVISTPLVVWTGFNFKHLLNSGSAGSLETALSCGVFAIFCVMCLLGWTSFLQVRETFDDTAQKEKDKQKQKFIPKRGATKRETAYDHLLETGVLYEGRIAEIIELTHTVRQISFHFGPKSVIKSGVFVTESPVELALYDTLVVISDGVFTVLI